MMFFGECGFHSKTSSTKTLPDHYTRPRKWFVENYAHSLLLT